MEYYNLDAILSVGYRVNSQRGTQFRIWATNVLRQHLLQGYTVNERRLRELRQSFRLIEHVLDAGDAISDEAAALLRLVTDYTAALDLLDDYDHQRITLAATTPGPATGVSYDEALRIADTTLVAMTLLIAVSRPAERDIIIAIVMHLINSQR